jgi:hypothetical protein
MSEQPLTSEVGPTVEDPIAQQRDALAERPMLAGRDATELATVYLGECLGLYDALAAASSSTPAELAARTGAHERYVREWLEQQTIAAILEVEDATIEPEVRRYRLPEAHRAVLVERDSRSYGAAGARFTADGRRYVSALRRFLDRLLATAPAAV